MENIKISDADFGSIMGLIRNMNDLSAHHSNISMEIMSREDEVAKLEKLRRDVLVKLMGQDQQYRGLLLSLLGADKNISDYQLDVEERCFVCKNKEMKALPQEAPLAAE
jgi:hypothetical protein